MSDETKLATRQNAAPARWTEPETLDGILRMAGLLAQSGLAPDYIRTAETAAITMAMGADIGLTCESEAARMVCPDVIGGYHTADEAREDEQPPTFSVGRRVK